MLAMILLLASIFALAANFVPAATFVLAANLMLVVFFGPFCYSGSHECHDSQKRSSHLGFWSIIVFNKFCFTRNIHLKTDAPKHVRAFFL